MSGRKNESDGRQAHRLAVRARCQNVDCERLVTNSTGWHRDTKGQEQIYRNQSGGTGFHHLL